MTADLKPCPFCGVEASEFKDRGHSTAYNVGCFNGDCTIEPNTWADTKAEAIAAWNTRALPAVTVGVKQLREAFNAGCDYGWDQAKHDERGGPEPLTSDEAFSAFLAALEPVTAPTAKLDAGGVREAWEKAYWRLRSYTFHDNNCKLNKPPRFDGPCSCGLTAALEEALALIGEKK